MFSKARILVAAGAMFAASTASADYFEDLLVAADDGECIEVAAAVMIESEPDKAGEIVSAALQAVSLREEQQKALGCQGDVAERAIAAGADPDLVLGATAAGIAPGAGAPANLGGIGGGNAGTGAGSASAS